MKKTGYTAYYNRIPTILEIMGYEHKIDYGGSEVVEACMDDFCRMSARFSGVGYFPNLRFTALRIMMLNGVEFGYDIPVLRTGRKIKGAIEIFDELYF